MNFQIRIYILSFINCEIDALTIGYVVFPFSNKNEKNPINIQRFGNCLTFIEFEDY